METRVRKKRAKETKPRQKVENIICPICKEEFKPKSRTQVCCSRECAGENKWVQQEKHVCSWCGDEFRRLASRIKGENKYCSMACYGESMKGKCIRKKGRKTRTFNCEFCGKEVVQQDYSPNNMQKFCSITCSNNKRWEREHRMRELGLAKRVDRYW